MPKPKRRAARPKSDRAEPPLDFVIGVEELAEYIGRPLRQTKYMVERGDLPVFRLGRRVCARKSQIDAALRAETGG